MDTKEVRYRFNWRSLLTGLLSGMLLVAPIAVQAQTVSVTPENEATDVATTANVVFSFSEAMNTDEDFTSITFVKYTLPLPGMVEVNIVWSDGGRRATVTPATSWPANSTIMWVISGETADTGDTIDEIGSFETSSGSSGGGGTGTNEVTSFSVMVFHFYDQTNASAPVLDTDAPYGFMAATLLASNHTANSITVTPPGSQAIPLTRNPVAAESFFLMDYTNNNLTLFNQRYPAGNYNFVMSGTPSINATVTLQATSQQPPAPHVSNFAAAQSVVATQAFTLTWDAWAGGTAQDFIQVSVGTNWHSPHMHEAGALRGEATLVTIPVNRLQPNTTYTASIDFTRITFITNASPVYVKSAARATTTEFTFVTTSGVAPTAPRLANAIPVGSDKFGFSVIAPAGQSLTLQGSETLLSNSWTTVYTTNADSGTTLIVLPKDPAGKRFYRLRSP